jgi:hypothetical protein
MTFTLEAMAEASQIATRNPAWTWDAVSRRLYREGHSVVFSKARGAWVAFAPGGLLRGAGTVPARTFDSPRPAVEAMGFTLA